jgi:hypothetical protein
MGTRNPAHQPNERFKELLGLKSVLTEIRRRLKNFALSEAVEHLEITDIALTRALIEIKYELDGAKPPL